MSLIFLLQTLGGISICLLKRQLNFKAIQFARITSYFAGFFGLGIPLALLGLGVWSLVFAQLAQTALFSILCYGHTRHAIKPLFSSRSNGLERFGLKVLATNLVNYLIGNLDTFFVGRFFDVMTLGLYNRVFILVSTPMNSVVASVQQVTFAAYSRMQDNPETVRRGYLAGLGFMAMLMLPIFGCAALVPATVIQGLFGTQWEAGAPFLVPLALAMPFHAAMATGGPLLWANDRVGREFLAQIVTVFVLLIVLVATSRVSATALAWGVLGVTIIRFLLITNASLKTVGATWHSLFSPIGGSIILLIFTGIAVFFADHAMQLVQVAASSRLLLDVLAGVIAFLATILLAPRWIVSREMYWLAERVKPSLPTFMRLLLTRLFPPVAVSA